jgi:eukaryotic-like serine/threonine-protein kinase
MRYTYRWGQRPLEGYTIKRGLGHGGFGEVYFAISDGGKEVALKLIRGQTDVRGSQTCLNLKHSNLVHLYDLRKDAHGDAWLIMEFIHGETLDSIVRQHPEGLSEPQARAWFLELAKAVAYLHDHAIIHRDIKPLNIFVEQNVLKLGDYGLSKSVTHTQVAHTSNAGSILYMAPEIASGNYSKQIDIYACGVVLFEMLTGDVPFKGESWNEIAFRHQTDDPDLHKLPAAYQPILRKALDKKPGNRYKDMQEMILDVEALGSPIPTLESRFVARLQEPLPSNTSISKQPSQFKNPPGQTPEMETSGASVRALPLPGWQGKLRELAPGLASLPLIAIPGALVWGFVNHSLDWSVITPVFLVTIAIASAILIPAKFWDGSGKGPSRFVMLFLGLLIGAGVFWLDGWPFPKILMRDDPAPPTDKSFFGGTVQSDPDALQAMIGYMLYFGIALGAVRWWQAADRRREERFTLFPMLVAGFWGTVLLLLSHVAIIPPMYAIIALAGAAGAVQIVSPWVPPPPPPPRKLRLNTRS